MSVTARNGRFKLPCSSLKDHAKESYQNPLFNSALKQSSAVRKDLDTFADSPSSSSPALQGTSHITLLGDTFRLIWYLAGQISASLTSFSRTIDEYADLAKKELIQTKQEKAYERLKTFREELGDYRERFSELRRQREDNVKPLFATGMSHVYKTNIAWDLAIQPESE